MSSKVTKYRLFWDEWNLEHIKKHNVSKYEVETAVKAKRVAIGTYKGRLLILGKTKRGRLIIVTLSFEKQEDAYVVSARDVSKKERKIYEENKTS